MKLNNSKKFMLAVDIKQNSKHIKRSAFLKTFPSDSEHLVIADQ